MTASILILDDSLTVRMDLADAFESAGMKPLPCACIRDARDIGSRHRIDLDRKPRRVERVDRHLPGVISERGVPGAVECLGSAASLFRDRGGLGGKFDRVVVRVGRAGCGRMENS